MTAKIASNRHGMTMTDLCVGMALLLFLLAIFPAIADRLGEESLRAKCASNLKNIAAALITYANANQGAYPRTIYDPANPRLTEFTGIHAADPFKPGGPKPNDVTAAFFLLLRSSGITTSVVLCPMSDGDPLDWTANPSLSNFPSPQNLTYSLNNPYPSAAALKAGWKWDSSLGSDFALASDLNPGSAALVTVPALASTSTMQTVNSPNHDGRGQNVLYGDYHAAWQVSPFCGDPRPGAIGPEPDNIFTSQTTPLTVGGTPQDAHDSVLLPMATDGFHRDPRSRAQWEADWLRANWGLVVAWGLVMIIAIFWIVWWRRGIRR